VADEHSSAAITRLLLDATEGNLEAREQMLPLVYDELRRLAAGYMNRERPDHTIQATALVHEAYLRLIDQQRVDWQNRAQFVGLAAVMMRRILVNHARDRVAAKRGGVQERISLSVALDVFSRPAVDVLALHEALERLSALDARKVQIVELKFFGGMTTAEIAKVLAISTATVEREWHFARAWLYAALSDDAQPPA
jgi:RNA polymerase sigma factor (TIGR02999 family)